MATQASPGLNAPSAYQALPGVPQNMSIQAAVSAGLLPMNVQISGPNVGASGAGSGTTPSLASVMSTAGTNGSSSATASGAVGGSPNMGAPSSGPAGNPMNGGNPGAPPEQELSYPASALTGLSSLIFTG